MNNCFNTIKENFKKRKWLTIIFLVLWVLIVFFSLVSYKDTLGKASYGNKFYHYVETMNSSKTLSQVVDVVDNSDSVSIRLEVYKKDKSHINIEVVGLDSQTIYANQTLQANKILGASYNTIAFNTKLDSNVDKKIQINITSDDDNESIGVWCSTNNQFDDNFLYLNGDAKEGSMTLRVLYQDSFYSSFNNVVVSIVIIASSILLIYLLLGNPKDETIFAAFVLIFGFIFIVILTPLSGPDEEYHYRQALVRSNKLLQTENPKQIEDVYIGYYNFVSNYNVGEAYKTLIENFDSSLLDLQGRRMLEIDDSAVYSYDLCYAPQAIGITLGRLLKLNFIKTYYLGRLFSLLFYTVCVYLSIRFTPVLKKLFGVVAMLPVCLQQAAVYSQDMWIIALSMLVFGCFLKWYYQETKITKLEFVFTFIVIALLAPAKYVYSMFALLFILVPEKNFYSKKHKIISLMIFLVPTIYYIGSNILSRVLPLLVNVINADDYSGVGNIYVENYYSIRYIISNPIQTIKIIFNTIKVNLKSWIAGATGRYLSGLSLIVPSKLSYMFIVLLFSSSIIFEKYNIGVSIKMFCLFICVTIFMFTLAIMLVSWTSIEDVTIQGIQGRYITPMLVYGFSVFNNKKIYIPEKLGLCVLFVQIVTIFEVILYILSYTYIY